MASCVTCGLSDTMVSPRVDDPEWKACRCGHTYRYTEVEAKSSRYTPMNDLLHILNDESLLDLFPDTPTLLWPIPRGVLGGRDDYHLVDVDDRQAKAYLSNHVTVVAKDTTLVVIGLIDRQPNKVLEKIQRLKPHRIQFVFGFLKDAYHRFTRDTAIQFIENNLAYSVTRMMLAHGLIIVDCQQDPDGHTARGNSRFTEHSSAVVHYYHNAAFANRREALKHYQTVYLLFSGPTINQWKGPEEAHRTSYRIMGCKGVIEHERWGGELDGYFCGDAVFNRQRMTNPIPFERLKPDCDVYCASTERGRWMPEHGVNDKNINVLRDSLYPRRVFLLDFTHEEPYQLTTDGRGALVGHNTGLLMFQAAVLLGARRIVLVGADCTRAMGDRNNHFNDTSVTTAMVRDDYLKHWRALHEWNLAHFTDCKAYVKNPVGLVGLWDTLTNQN